MHCTIVTTGFSLNDVMYHTHYYSMNSISNSISWNTALIRKQSSTWAFVALSTAVVMSLLTEEQKSSLHRYHCILGQSGLEEDFWVNRATFCYLCTTLCRLCNCLDHAQGRRMSTWMTGIGTEKTLSLHEYSYFVTERHVTLLFPYKYSHVSPLFVYNWWRSRLKRSVLLMYGTWHEKVYVFGCPALRFWSYPRTYVRIRSVRMPVRAPYVLTSTPVRR